ncbi:MAG: hypothetical protein H8E31_11425 [Planctomycetes bacterium]|nr:hypothetical protein [Planctomycetota bacterium]
MNLLRRIAWYALLAAVVLVGWQALLKQVPWGVAVVDEPPEGFHLPVEGIGEVGFGIRGPVRITLSREQREPGGVRRAVPTMTVDGRNPRPAEAAMVLDQTVIRALGEEGRAELYRVEAPRASLALKREVPEPTPDPSRPWKLKSPVLTMPTPHGELRLEVEAASLVPDSGILDGEGVFSLKNGGMSFSGKNLRLDLKTGEVEFGDQGPLAWSFPTPRGGLFQGRSDGGGSLTELEDGGRRLELPAEELCELLLPPESGLEGRFRSHGFVAELDPAPEAGGWVPRSARGGAPSSWTGILANGRECSVFGQDAVLVWDGEPFHGVDLRGPLVAFLGEDSRGEEGGWLASGGGAYLSATSLDLLLYGGVVGQIAPGWFETETYLAGQGGWVAEGGVSLADGQVVTDRFESRENGSQRLDGAVLFRPTQGVAVAAPQLTLGAQDELKPGFRQFRAEGGVVTHLDLRAEPAVLRSQELEAKGDLSEGQAPARDGAPPIPAGIRLDARHSVRLERGEAVFTGEHFAAHAEERMELRGRPARAEVPRRDESGAELGVATLEAARLVLHHGEVIPVGDPVLVFPAAELGLVGEEVRLQAERMRFREDGSAGSLRGHVVAEGGLGLEAAAAEWRAAEPGIDGAVDPDPILTLRPDTGRMVVLRGQLLPEPDQPAAQGWKFDLQARAMRVNLQSRVGFLEGDAQMRLELDQDDPAAPAEVLEMRGRYAEVSVGSGHFLHNATLRQEGGNGGAEGGADRIDWRRNERGVTLELSLGRPWLSAQGVRAEAADIVLELNRDAAEGSVLELSGSAERPARLTLPNGKVLVGERLRYNFLTRLYDTGSSRLATEDDRP